MTTKAYNWTTRACMAAAVCSAVLFDQFPGWRIPIALLGAVAGVVAISVYFWNLWSTEAASLQKAEEATGLTTLGRVDPSSEEPPISLTAGAIEGAHLDIVSAGHLFQDRLIWLEGS